MSQQLAGQIVNEIVLTTSAQVSLQPFDSISRRAAGEGGRRINGATAQVLAPSFSHRTETLEHQPERVEACVTTGAARVLAMTREQVAQRQVQLCFIARQFRYGGWRR